MRKYIRMLASLYPIKSNLHFLANVHGTDKLAHGYIECYRRHFAPLRKRRLKILEIGIGGYKRPQDGGESLRMWKDYFPNSTIYGIDIYDKSPHQERRIRILRGSQNDPDFLRHVAQEVGCFDIIIDDGSHINEHVITSFGALFPFLSSNGFYVIEDLQTSYWPQFGGNWRSSCEAITSISTAKELVDGLNYQYIPNREIKYTDDKIRAIHFHPKIVFIEKDENSSEVPPYILQEIDAAGKL
jgi:8-demethyl-8-alpha-L-rhamnosyltetracenomycin-C 2'-O-methyltransferase